MAWVLAIGLVGSASASVQAQGGDTITVAPDGSGDHASIREAVAAARDSDIVLLSPGRYEEGFLIDKPITLAGSGSRDEVVIDPAPGGELTWDAPWGEQVPTAAQIIDADAVIEHLSFESSGDQIGLLLDGGAPTLRDVSISGNDIVMVGGEPVFRDARIDTYFAVRGASPTVEDSEIVGHASVDGPGRTIIRRSTLLGGTSASADATGSYEDNLFIGGLLAVDSGSDMVVSGNTVRDIDDNEAAILVIGDGSSAEIVGNTVERAAIGISVKSSEPASVVTGNTIRDVRVGIHVDSLADTRIEDNEIVDARTVGILLQRGRPLVAGNRICGSTQPFEFRDGADPQLGTNDVCEDA
jgi:hypothetical protein